MPPPDPGRFKAIENAYEPLTPDALPDWTQDTSLIGWLDSLGR